MDNYEDCYYLAKLEDGQLQVEHSWSHVTPSLKSDSGSQTYTMDEFTQSTDVHSNAQIAPEGRPCQAVIHPGAKCRMQVGHGGVLRLSCGR